MTTSNYKIYEEKSQKNFAFIFKAFLKVYILIYFL